MVAYKRSDPDFDNYETIDNPVKRSDSILDPQIRVMRSDSNLDRHIRVTRRSLEAFNHKLRVMKRSESMLDPQIRVTRGSSESVLGPQLRVMRRSEVFYISFF